MFDKGTCLRKVMPPPVFLNFITFSFEKEVMEIIEFLQASHAQRKKRICTQLLLLSELDFIERVTDAHTDR